MSETKPTRRTLVKGAAWSVPVVAVSAHAAHAAASTLCTLSVTVQCAGSATAPRLIFGYTITGAEMPDGSLTFGLGNYEEVVGLAEGEGADYDATTGVITVESPQSIGTLVSLGWPGTGTANQTFEYTVSISGQPCGTTFSATGCISKTNCNC